jgi:hypothetical protein
MTMPVQIGDHSRLLSLSAPPFCFLRLVTSFSHVLLSFRFHSPQVVTWQALQVTFVWLVLRHLKVV